MKRYLGLALAATLLAAPMAGCSTLAMIQPAASVELTASRALYAAEAAFSGVSIALETAVDSGRLKGAAAAKARKAYGKAREALLLARATKDANTRARAASEALSAIAEAQQLATTGGGFNVGSF